MFLWPLLVLLMLWFGGFFRYRWRATVFLPLLLMCVVLTAAYVGELWGYTGWRAYISQDFVPKSRAIWVVMVFGLPVMCVFVSWLFAALMRAGERVLANFLDPQEPKRQVTKVAVPQSIEGKPAARPPVGTEASYATSYRVTIGPVPPESS